MYMMDVIQREKKRVCERVCAIVVRSCAFIIIRSDFVHYSLLQGLWQ